MQLWPPRRRRKKLWLFDRRFSKKTWGKLAVFSPIRNIVFLIFFRKGVFFAKAKKSQEFPLWSEIDTAHASPIGGGGAKEQKRHYVIIVRETAAGRLGEGKKKLIFVCSINQMVPGEVTAKFTIDDRFVKKKSGGENNINNNNIYIHSFDLGKPKRDFPGRNSVLRNSVARTISKNISKIRLSLILVLFHI